MTKERLTEAAIAMRVLKEFQDGDYVNLGMGIPLLCAQNPPVDKQVFFHAEQGVIGFTRVLYGDEREKADLDYVDALGNFIPPDSPGISFFDIDASFDMIRGGYLDASVLGGLEVSEKGDLANWTWGAPEESGIGGSMDLAVGAKRVIVAMLHTVKDGNPKVVKRCKLPLTARECVDLIITDLAVIEVTPRGLLLTEIAPGWTVEQVQALTEPRLLVSPELKEIEL